MSATIGLSTLTTYIICNGTGHVVQTTQQPGESNSAFAQRHKDAVAAVRSGCSTFSEQSTNWSTPVTCNGVMEAVVTVKDPNNSYQEFQEKHEAAVAAAAAACS